jgi:hypothetical protein
MPSFCLAERLRCHFCSGETDMKHMTLRLAAFGLGIAIAIGSVAAQAADRVKAGTLSCDVSGGIGLIIASKKSMTCRFEPVAPGWVPEAYTGSIGKLGIDLGATTGAQMVWAVFAAGSPAPGALAGDYAGATAEATLAIGLGANVLVGGSHSSIALQPLSITGQTGLNVAAGVAVLKLRPRY